MKVLVFPLIFLFLSLKAFSQSGTDDAFKQNHDMNGVQLKNGCTPFLKPCFDSIPLTSYKYDSVRAMAELNDPLSADAYPWISEDGLRLYYMSGGNKNQLMFTQRAGTDSYFDDPTQVTVPDTNCFSYWLSTDELDLYSSDGSNLFYSHRDSVSQPFNEHVSISLSGTSWSFISGPSLNKAQDELFLYSAEIGITEFSRTSLYSFAYTGTLSAPAGYYFTPGQLSKDDLTFFIGASWNSLYNRTFLYQMTRDSSSGSFDPETFRLIQGINDSSVWNDQPTMSDNLQWVVFVRSDDVFWENNDLFIAHKGNISSVFNSKDLRLSSSCFPNPSSEYFFINYRTSSGDPVILSVFSPTGTIIYENVLNPFGDRIKIDTRAWKSGLYFYTLSQFNDKKCLSGTGKFVVLH
jgi:hypothetical protein